MPFTDHIAASKIRDLREDRGLSQEGLAAAVKRCAREGGWYKDHGAVDAFTVRRIERDGHVPSLRVQVVLALFFGIDRRSLWNAANRRAAV